MDTRGTDEQLLAAFVKGDRDALGALARRYEPSLLGLARALLGGSSPLAMDAVQETWVRVIRYGASFNGRSSFRTWLYRIAINRCRDLTPRARPAAPGDEEAAARSAAEESRGLAGPLDAEHNRTLHDAVARLGEAKREVVLLCYHEGMTHELAAQVLEIPLGTLKSRLHAALCELRETLGEKRRDEVRNERRQ